MKIFFILFLLSSLSFSCELDKKSEFISLSGPISSLLDEMDLLPSLKAMSDFSHRQSSKVKRIKGGVFLSPRALRTDDQTVIFYDKSTSLEKTLKEITLKQLVEVDLLSLSPYEAFMKTKMIIKPFVHNCSRRLSLIHKKYLALNNANKKMDRGKPIVLYLGKIKKNKYPQLIFGHDGISIFIKKYGNYIVSSKLPYLPWSSKLKKKYPKETKHFGVYENENLSFEKVKQNNYNFSCPGVLTPGLDQIICLQKLLTFITSS